MPWNNKQEELVTMKKQKEIMESIPVAQRANPSLIRERQKAAIAEKAQCVSCVDDGVPLEPIRFFPKSRAEATTDFVAK